MAVGSTRLTMPLVAPLLALMKAPLVALMLTPMLAKSAGSGKATPAPQARATCALAGSSHASAPT